MRNKATTTAFQKLNRTQLHANRYSILLQSEMSMSTVTSFFQSIKILFRESFNDHFKVKPLLLFFYSYRLT